MRMYKFFSAVLLLLATMTSAADKNSPANDLREKVYTKAQNELAHADYKAAYTDFSVAAKNGHALAQFSLGLMFHNGWGRAVDRAAACHWFVQAAGQRIPAAEHYWAECLRDGVTVKPDIPAATAMFRQAGNDGHLLSYCSMGELLFSGEAQAADPGLAIELCTKAANARSPKAMLMLFDWYHNQTAIKDDHKAQYWLDQAAQSGASEAQFLLGMAFRQLHDNAQSISWLRAAAAQGDQRAYCPLAASYYEAPVDTQTQMPTAENLANTYVWLRSCVLSRASGQVPSNDTDPAVISDIKVHSMLNDVLGVMPDTWTADLDKKVSEHLQMFPLITAHGQTPATHGVSKHE